MSRSRALNLSGSVLRVSPAVQALLPAPVTHAGPVDSPGCGGQLSATVASDYRQSMPAGDASMDSQLHDLYAQAEAARKQSRLLAAELRALWRKTSEHWQLIRAAWDHTEQIQAQRLAVRSHPDLLQYSAYARLQARLASLPVIEQAKGVIMAKYGWPEDQAFEALRRASQRENIKVRELAARIVAQTARPAPAPRKAGPAPAPRQARPVAAAAPAGGGAISPLYPGTAADRPA